MPRPKIVHSAPPAAHTEAPREATVRLVQGRMEKLLDAADNLKELLANRLPLLYPEDWEDIGMQLHASVDEILNVQHSASRPRFQLRRS